MTWIVTYKLWLVGGGAFFLFLMESIAPFRRWHERRWRHIMRNVVFIAGNALVMSALYGVILGGGALVRDMLHIGMLYHVALTPWMRVIVIFIMLDIALYAWHRMNHIMPFLWRFHKVHHSDRDVDFTSSARFHIGELLLSAIVKSMLLVVLGASVAEIVAFDVMVTLFALFNHSNISLGRLEPFVRLLIVTPAMHRIHHSVAPRETNTNYTTILSLWDHVFGSYCFFADQRRLRIGLTEYLRASSRTLGRMYLMPFTKK